jgi:hypothetical protein
MCDGPLEGMPVRHSRLTAGCAIGNIMLENIHAFRTRVNSIELTRRITMTSPVTLLSIRQVSEHEAFGLDRDASPATIRKSCWPIGEDAPQPRGAERTVGRPADLDASVAAGADLRAILAASALDAASPGAVETNRHRLRLICHHYRKVAEGRARFADVDFTTNVMRPFVTWLQALCALDNKTHGSCGQCAKDLMSIIILTEQGRQVTLRQLGATDGVARNIDGRAIANYFIDQIGPVLDDFHDAVANRGAGSRTLAVNIEWLKTPPQGTSSPRQAS